MSDLRVRDALDRMRRRFLDQPASARNRNTPATAVWRGGLKCEIAGPNGDSATTDMPAALGGEASGPNPGWLMRASLASCAATVIAMQAAQRGIALRSLAVEVESCTDARGLLGIDGVPTGLDALRLSIRIAADDVPEDQLRQIAEAGQALSPVACTLRAGLAVEIAVG